MVDLLTGVHEQAAPKARLPRAILRALIAVHDQIRPRLLNREGFHHLRSGRITSLLLSPSWSQISPSRASSLAGRVNVRVPGYSHALCLIHASSRDRAYERHPPHRPASRARAPPGHVRWPPRLGDDTAPPAE